VIGLPVGVGDTMSVVSAVNATTFALISEDGGPTAPLVL
jgi:hypothetical protein